MKQYCATIERRTGRRLAIGTMKVGYRQLLTIIDARPYSRLPYP